MVNLVVGMTQGMFHILESAFIAFLYWLLEIQTSSLITGSNLFDVQNVPMLDSQCGMFMHSSYACISSRESLRTSLLILQNLVPTPYKG